jgi:Tfp pilus assembly protein PilN
MIQINLIPPLEKKKRNQTIILFYAILAFSSLIMILAWIFANAVSANMKIKKQIHQVEQESMKYQSKINEIKQLQADTGQLKSYYTAVKQIRTTQNNVLEAINDLAIYMPKDIWLTSIEQGVGTGSNQLSIQGYAYSTLSVKRYFNRLRRPGLPLQSKNLNILQVAISPPGSMGTTNKAYQFEINFSLGNGLGAAK